jgi:hypothetical protein
MSMKKNKSFINFKIQPHLINKLYKIIKKNLLNLYLI